MIDAKDTFYLMLRDRIAALNPARTIVLRGVTRPGVLVAEYELPNVAPTPDAFTLHWTALTVESQLPLPLATLTCELRYSTAGTSGNAGMDRGRLLAAMDAELATALTMLPRSVPKQSFTANAAPLTLGTSIFWGDAVFAPATATDEVLARTATVQIFAYQEVNER